MAEHINHVGVSGKDDVGPAKKRGRPQIAVTEEVLERRRLARQRYNARRSKTGEGPSRKRGRPKGVHEAVLNSQSLSVPRLETCPIMNNNVSGASHTDAAWPLIPPTSSTQDGEPAEGGKGNKDPGSASCGGTNQGQLLMLMMDWFLRRKVTTPSVYIKDRLELFVIEHPPAYSLPAYNTHSIMPQSTMISALTSNMENHTIRVRVGRIWEAINKKTKLLLYTNIILLDEQDNHILATVRNNQKQVYLPLLKEEGVYNISNFKLVPAPALYRSVDIDLAISFYYKIKIEEKTDMNEIPLYKFELQPFDRVKNLVGQVKCLIDVIVMVLSYGQMEKRSNGAEMMDVVLTNE
ncbi:uncharacterized protein LOC141688959 isoform X3 [Apium graveolens]|uniref:uncharacterized protein LOC141688959 isoform X3 n=1 Tax=Apium graveolens TaxID=4045 RepID=UPI003D7B67C3